MTVFDKIIFLSLQLQPTNNMEADVHIKVNTQLIKNEINDSSKNSFNKKGKIKDRILTRTAVIYTFFIKHPAESPIVLRSINRRTAKQHCDIITETIKTHSGTSPICNKTYENGRFSICVPPTAN